jgi:hypothetical protein
MRILYWSNSKFADKLRSLFGIAVQPTSTSFGGWENYRNESKNKSKLGYLMVESLDIVQNIVSYIPDKIRNITYFIGNIKHQTHVLKTRAKFGVWSDLVTKIPDALMLSVIDFVENEAFHMMVCYESDSKDPIIIAHNNQSYMKRKMFPMKIDSSVRGEYGIQWVNFQIRAFAKNKRDIERHPYQKIIAAYLFAKYEYFQFDAWKLVDYNFDSSKPFEITEEKSEAYKKISELEKEFSDEVTKHCNNIVKYRDYLWT